MVALLRLNVFIASPPCGPVSLREIAVDGVL